MAVHPCSPFYLNDLQNGLSVYLPTRFPLSTEPQRQLNSQNIYAWCRCPCLLITCACFVYQLPSTNCFGACHIMPGQGLLQAHGPAIWFNNRSEMGWLSHWRRSCMYIAFASGWQVVDPSKREGCSLDISFDIPTHNFGVNASDSHCSTKTSGARMLMYAAGKNLLKYHLLLFTHVS